MRKQKPPSNIKDRQNWDATRHWKKTFGKRIIFDEIIPEHIQQYRKFMVQNFKQNGFLSAKKTRNELVAYFERGKKNGTNTQLEVDWIANNLDSLLAQMKKQQLKKSKK
jgi:hypothetical protein